MEIVRTPEPDPPYRSEPPRAPRGGVTTRGMIVEIRGTILLVTVMPAGAPPYRARVSVFPHQLTGIHVGSYVELIVGNDPSDIRLAQDSSPAV